MCRANSLAANKFSDLVNKAASLSTPPPTAATASGAANSGPHKAAQAAGAANYGSSKATTAAVADKAAKPKTPNKANSSPENVKRVKKT